MKYPYSIGLALVFAVLTSCSEHAIEKLEGAAQGTSYHISYWSPNPINPVEIKSSIENEFTVIDKELSNYRKDSDIEIFNHTETTDSQVVNPEIISLIRIAKSVAQASQGCYDLTIKPLFDLWGFRGDTLTIPTENAIRDNLSLVGMDKLEIIDDNHLRKQLPQLKVDLGSIAQGYSVERLSKLLEQKGIHDYMVEIGGELKTQGLKPDTSAWRIAVERPLPGQQVMHKVITMPKQQPLAVMTSGTYHHYFDDNGKRYSHIFDARTGRPVTHDLVSVTVLNSNPTLADAWSTTLLCLGQQEGMKAANTANIAALFIQQQGNGLNESRSDPLTALDTITIH
jgi:thiamine biosynthesis lipoprotein